MDKIYLCCLLDGPRYTEPSKRASVWSLTVWESAWGRLRCRWCCSFLCPSFSRDGCVLLIPCRRFPFGCVYFNFLCPRASAVYLCLATGTMWAKLRSLSWWNAQMRRIKGFHFWLIRMIAHLGNNVSSFINALSGPNRTKREWRTAANLWSPTPPTQASHLFKGNKVQGCWSFFIAVTVQILP